MNKSGFRKTVKTLKADRVAGSLDSRGRDLEGDLECGPECRWGCGPE